MAEWSSIPRELVGLIANKLSTIEDYMSLTAVCRSYRSDTKEELWRPDKVSQPPWLLLSCLDESEDLPTNDRRGLLSMYRHRKKAFMNLPELNGRRCWGSAYGWIVTLGLDRKLHLFNPLSRRRIPLPDPICPQEWGDDDNHVRRHYMDKAILIKRPPSSYSSSGSDDFLVVTTKLLAEFSVMRPGTWEDVEFLCSPGVVFDVICYKNQIYAASSRGRLLICSNFDGPGPATADEFVMMHDSQFEGYAQDKFYLVESLGKLLLVARYKKWSTPYRTYGFEVFKLDFETKRWIQIEDLEGCAFFVGCCQSISLSQPEEFNCKPNYIYFIDDNYELNLGRGGRDMGMYDFKQGTIKSLYQGRDSVSTYSFPIWFIPNF